MRTSKVFVGHCAALPPGHSMLLQLYKAEPQFERIHDIGNERGLKLANPNSADPRIGSQNTGKCKLAILLNYQPIRDDGQPCIVMVMRIIHMILVAVFLYTAEYATKFLSENVVILDRCPFELDYNFVQDNRDWYKALLAETDGPMKAVLSQVLSTLDPKAVLALGDSAYDFVSSIKVQE